VWSILDAYALRNPSEPSTSDGKIGRRPELNMASSGTPFMNRYVSSIAKYVRRASIKQVASMSLSGGRKIQPEWLTALVSQRPNAVGLTCELLEITSPVTDRKLLTIRCPASNVHTVSCFSVNSGE
jgi:hypothetical protein